jgi:hypothetical protein
VFRRRGKGEPDADDDVEVTADEASDVDAQATADEAGGVDVPDSDAVSSGAAAQATGPYDVDDAPGDEIPRVDLGALRVPVIEGLEIRLDMDEQTGDPAQLVLADGDSMMQLGVYAAPRSSGIWGEVRAEIAESLRGAGGSSEELDGPLGVELTASIPTGEPGGGFAPARFIGVDRPRWFLRGLVSGPAALDRDAATRLEFVLRGTIVVRGKDAMPIRDPLPLHLPPEAAALAQEQAEAAAAAQDAAPTLDQLDPGPTITETR